MKKHINEINLPKDKQAFVYIVNSLEDLKKEVLPTSYIAREICRIESIALCELLPYAPNEIEWRGYGYYELKEQEAEA